MRSALAPTLVALLALLVACGPAGQAPPSSAPAEAPAPDLDTLRAAVEQDPSDPQARRRLAIALHAEKELDEAVLHFETLVELEPQARHLLDLALVYTELSRLAEAERLYQRILGASPNEPVVLHNLGNIAMTRGDDDDAIDYYERSLQIKPDYIMAKFHLGSALKRAGRYEEAYRTFEEVLGLEPTNARELEVFDDALYELATLDLEMGERAGEAETIRRAARMLTELIRANPEHANAHYAYGRALMLLGREEEAQVAFDNHIKLQAAREPTGPAASRD